MAESALRGDKEAIDIGLVAFDFSNIMKIDFRDGFGAAGRLAFAARQCGIDIVERVTAVIPDSSHQLVLMFKSPMEPRVVRDNDGNLRFWSTASDTTGT